jgi:AcrR family transcriptional regulator
MTTEPKTSRGRESRDRIVERAAELVAERGVERTSLDDVLAAAGASKSQLYHYFSDREALIEAAIERRCAQVHEELTRAFADVDTLAELEQRLEGFVVLYEASFGGCPLGTMASEVAGAHEGALRHVESAFASWEAIFADLFTRLRDRGDLRVDADPDALATALLAALEGGQLLSQARKDARSLRIAISTTLAYARGFSA